MGHEGDGAMGWDWRMMAVQVEIKGPQLSHQAQPSSVQVSVTSHEHTVGT